MCPFCDANVVLGLSGYDYTLETIGGQMFAEAWNRVTRPSMTEYINREGPSENVIMEYRKYCT